MGILEHVSGLEDMMSGMEEAEKPKQKQKKAEAARPDSLSNSRLEKIEDSIMGLREAVEDLKNNAQSSSAETQPYSEAMEKLQSDMKVLREMVGNLGKRGAEGNNPDILRRLDETDKKIDETVADVGKKIETLKKAQTGENRGFFGLKPDSDKRIDEAIKRMDKNSEIIVNKQEEIRADIEERINRLEETAKSSGGKNCSGDMESLKKSLAKIMADIKNADSRISSIETIENNIEEKINGKLGEFSKKAEEVSKYDLGKLKSVADAERKIGENLKLFALNSDVEKLWKDAENSNEQIDGRIKTLEKKQGEISKMKDSVMNEIKDSMQHSMNGFKSGIDRHIGDAAKKMDEISEAIIKKQDALEKRIGERLGEAAAKSDMESARKMAEKSSLELRSKMDALQKYVEGKMGAMDKMIDEKIGSSAADGKDVESLRKFLNDAKNNYKNFEETSKEYDGRIKMLEKKQGEMKSSMQCGSSGINSGIDGRINDAVKKMDDTAAGIAKERESVRKELAELSKRIDGVSAYAPEMIKPLMEEDKKINERLNEFFRKTESIRSDTAKMVSEALRNIPKSGEIKKDIEERAGAMESRMEEKANNKLNEINSGIERFWKDAETSKRQTSERLKEFAGKSDLEKSLMEMKAAEKRFNEKIESVKRESDAFASKVDIGRLNNAVSGRLNEFSKKIEFVSKFDLDKINSLANAEKRIDENLKLFALNSDVEKVWKETESLKRYVDEKTKMADGLANSLRVWESRNMQLMEKEHDFDEKMGAFPELKLLEGRIRRMERAFVELQKRFVVAQITEPIIME